MSINDLERFLENRGADFLSWSDGCVVVSAYRDKQFRALGGDTNRLISFFEDYRNMDDAALHYIAALRAESTLPCAVCKKPVPFSGPRIGVPAVYCDEHARAGVKLLPSIFNLKP